MRRLDLLIEDSREETDNVEFTDTAGIKDNEFIRWANAGQDRLVSMISTKGEKIFTAESTITPVARQEEYTLPSDSLFNNRISTVEFSPTGRVDDYYMLEQKLLKQRDPTFFSDPCSYIRRGGTLLLSPIPSTGTGLIRVSYVKRLKRMDIRRARVLSVTTVGNGITALTFRTTVPTIDDTQLLKENVFCVSNEFGDQVMAGVPFDAIDTGTGVVTVTAGFTFQDGESISVGDYITSGRNSQNASELMEDLERYLIDFMNWKALKRDSSAESQLASQELLVTEQEIMDSFADIDDDILHVPMNNPDWM